MSIDSNLEMTYVEHFFSVVIYVKKYPRELINSCTAFTTPGNEFLS